MELKTCSWTLVIILFSLCTSFGIFLKVEAKAEELTNKSDQNSEIQTEREEILQEGGRYLACYWGSWSIYRDYPGNFTIDNFDASLCTHLIFAFARVKSDGQIFDIESTDRYWELEAKKKDNPALKTILAVGGYDDLGEIAKNFSAVASSPYSRGTFVTSAVDYMTKYYFDGLDFDWEYPNPRNESSEDVDNFVQLIKDTREGFNKLTEKTKKNYTLSAAVGCGQDIITNGYDIEGMAEYLDYFHLMTYDFKMWSDSSSIIGHHSPLNSAPDETGANLYLTSDAAVKTFLDGGAKSHQLVLGLAAYGKTFELTSREKHNFYDVAKGPGAAGPVLQLQGTMAYSEICHQVPLSQSPWEFHFDPYYQVPYAFNSSLWVGFDDEESAEIKTDYAEDNKLGGMMIWSIEQDDCNNICGGWYKCPITSAVKRRQEYHSQRRERQSTS